MPSSERDTQICGTMRPDYPQSAKCVKLEIQHCMPVLYRFVDEQYIDEFLVSGKLMISTIRRCRAMENSERADKHESEYHYVFIDGKGKCALDARVADNAFVLCTSLTQCAMHKNAHLHCLELHNVELLVDEITSQLRGAGYDVCEVMAGPCNYAEKGREIDLRGSGVSVSDLLMRGCEEGQLKADSRKVDRVLEVLGRGAFYTTKDFRFLTEHEYRILWLCKTAVPIAPVFVTIPAPCRFGCKIPAITLKEVHYDE